MTDVINTERSLVAQYNYLDHASRTSGVTGSAGWQNTAGGGSGRGGAVGTGAAHAPKGRNTANAQPTSAPLYVPSPANSTVRGS